MTPQLRWYYKNKEKAIAKNREWKMANSERVRENIKRWQAENRAKTKVYARKSKLVRIGDGITPEAYELLYTEQGGKCKICRKEQKTRRLTVDHCHKTGRIRALLCAGCNITLGHIEAYKDNPDRWDNYLASQGGLPAPKPAWEPPPEGYDPVLHGTLADWKAAQERAGKVV